MRFKLSYSIITGMATRKKKKPTAEEKKLIHIEVVRQMLVLATSGFGLVSALAWNEFIRTTVEEYVRNYLPTGSTIIYLFLYAVIVTILAVIITMQLSKLLRTLEGFEKKA